MLMDEEQDLPQAADGQSYELIKRVKELDCLYGVSKLVESSKTLDMLFSQVVRIIPSAFMYPERIGVRLAYRHNDYCWGGFSEGRYWLKADLEVHGKPVGELLIYKSGELTPEDRIFIERERLSLIREVARKLGRAVERTLVREALRDSEDRWRTMTGALAEGVLLYDRDGRVIAWNPSAERVLHLSTSAILEPRVPDPLVHALREDGTPFPAQSIPPMVTLRTGQPCNDVTMALQHDDGTLTWLAVNSRPLRRSGEERPHAAVVSFSDITQRKQHEIRLAQLATIVETSLDAMFSADAQRTIISWNSGAEHVFGYSAEEIIGRNMSILVPPDRTEELEQVLARVRRGEKVTNYDTLRLRKGGEQIYVSVSVAPIFDNAGRVCGSAAVARDITERKRMEQQLQYSAFHDKLTGVPNHSLFLDRLGHVLARAERFGEGYAVMVLDLDNFKLINDSLGHLVGDQLLCAFVGRIQELLRPVDTLARFGGDEFMLLLEEIDDADQVRHVAERILQALQPPFWLDKQEVSVSSSLGISMGDARYKEPNQIIRDADLALYEAKRRGKNQYVIFDAGMRGEQMSRLYLESELRNALLTRDIGVEFQPIVSLADQTIIGCESLARWRHPVLGVVDPERFISVAEDTGLVTPLGRLVMTTACQAIAGWLRHGLVPRDFYVSVNISPKEFYAADLVPFIQSLLEDQDLEGRNLRLEITENVIVRHDQEAAAILTTLRERGIRVCLDDFGTGYSSLSYLHQLPFDVIKVDRSFVHNLTDHQQSRDIVRSILGLAQVLGMEAIAEGAETEDQLEQTRALGFRWVQGYALHRPMNRPSLTELLSAT